MKEKLAEIYRQYQELTARMADPEVYSSPGLYQKIAKESADLEPVAQAYARFRVVDEQIGEAKEILETETDSEMRELAHAEIKELSEEHAKLKEEIRLLLIPKDPNDTKNVVLEIRAGTGGEEASLFTANLFRMYSRFAESKRWKIEILSQSPSDSGGLKEVVALITGQSVYSMLKFESGVHRVQRIPATESQGRIHTSACTVAVLPEAEDIELEIPERDMRIDVFRSSGPGGQSVNTTDSAVRITHLPSGLVVTCQDEKSQHKNKAKALKVLRSRLMDKMEAEAHAERASNRRAMVGSGDRSERIRTYNFPQNRVTDHRIGLTVYALDEIIEGRMLSVIEPVVSAQQAALLESGENSDI